MLFDAYLFVDWSGRNHPSPQRESVDAIWVGEGVRHTAGLECTETYHRTREACTVTLRGRLLRHIREHRRVLIGFDFPFGYPVGFAPSLSLDGGGPPWRRLWEELARSITDDERNESNRFEVAAVLNARCGSASPGPFWGCPRARETSTLKPNSPGFPYAARSDLLLERLRLTDKAVRGIQEAWKLYGTGSVGSQALLGIPRVLSLRNDPLLQDVGRIWPFETGFTRVPVPASGPAILYAEVWPGILRGKLDPEVEIRDQAQVRALVHWAAELDLQGELSHYFDTPSGLSPKQAAQCVEEEAWILGTQH
jgi:hypothetical protein